MLAVWMHINESPARIGIVHETISPENQLQKKFWGKCFMLYVL